MEVRNSRSSSVKLRNAHSGRKPLMKLNRSWVSLVLCSSIPIFTQCVYFYWLFTAATLERHPIPEFLMSIPIRKTRAGLQFTCAAATLSEKRDVWVCNSDGYVGQVCIMSLYPEPNVTSCNGVCNARILCVASVPAYNSSNRNSTGNGTQLQQQTQQTLPRSASTTPHSYTQQLRDYRKSISPNFQPPTAIGIPEKKKTPSAPTAGATSSIDASAGTDNANGDTSGGNQLDLNLSSSDDETDTCLANTSGCVGATGNNGSGIIERVPSPAPSTQTVASMTLPGSSSSGTPSHHSHQVSHYLYSIVKFILTFWNSLYIFAGLKSGWRRRQFIDDVDRHGRRLHSCLQQHR